MMQSNNPLKVSCKNCGAPADFDIINQTYRCGYCGQMTGIQEVNAREMNWRLLQKNKIKAEFAGQQIEEHSCTSCGATVVFQAGEASEKCDFCNSKLIRKELSTPEQMPDLIIPFFITQEEAKQRLLDWGHKHKNSPEGKKLLSNINKLEGYYLPYQIAHGPVHGEVSRDGNFRRFYYSGYLEGTAVNTSKQLSNFVLNGMEPFDWSVARPFEYGYITGNKVKLRDISDADTEKRVLKEVKNDFMPEVEKVMQTTGVNINIGAGHLSVISALLPVYFIKSGHFMAAMNGQTGRIAVSTDRQKVTIPWVIEPAIYTLLVMLLIGYFFQFDGYPMMIGTILSGILFFVIFGEGRASLIRQILKTSTTSQAMREDKVLKIKEKKGILKNIWNARLVFQEPNCHGQMVPVKLQFYGFGRILSIISNMILLIGAPFFTAAFLRAMVTIGTGEPFFDYFKPAYGAAWYILTGVWSIIYWAKGVRKDAYEHPIIYEILANGKKRLMGKQSSRRLSFLSMIQVGETDSSGKKITVFGVVKELGGIGIFMAIFLILLFLGSTFVIIS